MSLQHASAKQVQVCMCSLASCKHNILHGTWHSNSTLNNKEPMQQRTPFVSLQKLLSKHSSSMVLSSTISQSPGCTLGILIAAYPAEYNIQVYRAPLTSVLIQPSQLQSSFSSLSPLCIYCLQKQRKVCIP